MIMSLAFVLVTSHALARQAEPPALMPLQNDCTPEVVPDVVTADISAGIQRHIDAQSAQHDGYMSVPYDGTTLRLKLVRVHTEYLANLGPGKHFACVDMVTEGGEVYDVDFFMEGPAGAMRVTDTHVHKLNGQPFYLWEQETSGTWIRTKVDGASAKLLGIIEGEDRFEFLYQAMVPALTAPARMWVPVPTTDLFQTVTPKEMQVPGTSRTIREKRYKNTVIVTDLAPTDGGKTVRLRFEVVRKEKRAYAGDTEEAKSYLAPERFVPDVEQVRDLASTAVEGKKGSLMRARALYDHTMERMKYMKFGKGWGKGDLHYACDARSGNCTDFHAYFIGLCRSVGIPARFAIGAAIPSERNNAATDGYHCWAEFYADGKWWPVDISEADKYSSLSTYYFGRHPANRIEITRGRDLELEPGPSNGPINFLVFPILQIGESQEVLRPLMSFTRRPPVDAKPKR